MTTAEKSEAILREIVRRCNEAPDGDNTIGFGPDCWGGNTLTIFMEDSHTHAGCPGESFEVLVNNLYNMLVNGKGLGLAIPLDVE